MWDVRINRFTCIDRFAEKYPWQSPYAFAANNQVNNIDVNGDSIWVMSYNKKTGQLDIYYYGKDSNGNNSFINVNDKKSYVAGTDKFVDALSNVLIQIDFGENGSDLVENLMTAPEYINFYDSREAQKKKDQNFSGNDYVAWNPDNQKGGKDANGSTKRPSYIGLAHEMAHVESIINKTSTNIRWNGTTTVPIEEIPALHRENQIRAEHGLPLRTHYMTGDNATRVIIKNTRLSLYYPVVSGSVLPYPYLSK